MDRVQKILGADVELGNFIEGVTVASGSGSAAARLLLNEIPGVLARRRNVAAPSETTVARRDHPQDASSREASCDPTSNAQDYGRRFLPSNGGCAYVDLNHLELALPETFSAFDYVAYWRAMLLVARRAACQANKRLPAGLKVRAFVNCSDGHGHSYGAHANVLLTRAAWENITRRPHYLAYLAAFQVSSIVFAGAGKVGSENGRPWADFQLSQRADFIETLLGEQTTYNRPLINARDEPLCGPSSGGSDETRLARLHVIFFDATLCQVATLLRAGTLQMIAAMLEADCVSPHLALDDPLAALHCWSRDTDLIERARLLNGDTTTAVELQFRFLEEARRVHAAGGFNGIIPRVSNLLDLWEQTLMTLHERDFASLSRRIDWVLKRQVLQRAMSARPGLSWSSPEVRHLDQMFASLDEHEGLFWSLEQSNLVDHVISAADVMRAVQEPPDDTRAWTRAQLLRHSGRFVESVDWDSIDFHVGGRNDPWPRRRTAHLTYPFRGTRADHQHLFEAARSLDAIVSTLVTGRSAVSERPPRAH